MECPKIEELAKHAGHKISLEFDGRYQLAIFKCGTCDQELIRRNADDDEFFDISAVSREDVATIYGESANNLTDEDMKFLANKMGDADTSGSYWDKLEIFCDMYFGDKLTRKDEDDESED
jgi:hypothetical protein